MSHARSIHRAARDYGLDMGEDGLSDRESILWNLGMVDTDPDSEEAAEVMAEFSSGVVRGMCMRDWTTGRRLSGGREKWSS